MKIRSVEIQGFGPFKHTQHVDLGAFDDAGIFLIGGRTGSGKSTILDAICFALYGGVPRYDGYSGSPRYRSDHCDDDDVTSVTLVFEAGGREYRLRRTPDYLRPKKVGVGFTEQKATVELSVWGGGGWEGLETKAREVADRLAEIVKLNQKQFLQVILLAQNRFQEFLEAQSDERQTLLRTLFGTERFEDYGRLLHAKAGRLEEELSAHRAQADQLVEQLAQALELEPPAEPGQRPLWGQYARAEGAKRLELAARVEELAAAEAETARVALHSAELLVDRQRRRREAQARLSALRANAEIHASQRRRLEAAQRAAALLAPFEAADLAAEALQRASVQEAKARAALPSLPEGDLAEAVTEITATIGGLAAMLERESGLAALRSTAAEAAKALSAHDQFSASIAKERVALRERLGELEDEQREHQPDAEDLAAAQSDLTATQSARDAAREAAALAEQLEGLRALELEALRERTDAAAADEHLRRRHLLGRAALLAESLTDGEPCPVCGSLEHPQPAQGDGEPLSDDQLEAARMRLERAQAALDGVSRRRAEVEASAAERRGAAGGRSVEALQEELDSAHDRLTRAQAARIKLERLAQERAQLGSAQEGLDQRERAASAERIALAEAAALSQRALKDAEAVIEASLDGHESVAARVAELEHERVGLERLIVAATRLEAAAAQHSAARAALDLALQESGLVDRAAAESVMLTPEERAQLAAEIRAYEDGLVENRAVLEQPDLQNLPETTVDLDAARTRASCADSARLAATASRAALAERVARAQDLAGSLATSLERCAEIEERFNVVDGLAGVVRGDARHNAPGIPLESFVLAAELEEIVAAANERLRAMSQGRYTIEHSDERTRGGKRTGLEIVVYDSHTGAARSPRSLSGGEKFLASLALALGLAEVVTGRAGGIRLDTLFIDEGFGSLDDETLEIAMQTLDQLRQGGRTVGLISHVEAMKEQIPAKLVVEVADGGWSVIRQDLAPGAGEAIDQGEIRVYGSRHGRPEPPPDRADARLSRIP